MKNKVKLRIRKPKMHFMNGMTRGQMSAELKILMMEGKTNNEIADLLGYSCSAVRSFIRKLGLKNPYGCSPVKPSLSYEAAIKKLKALNGLGFPKSEHDVLNCNWQRKFY